MKIAIGSDHAGYDLKSILIKHIKNMGFNLRDFGTNSKDSCDYPDYAKEVALCVSNGEADMGILICGTGIGMSICANKIRGIRAALCVSNEMAKLSRQHNNANIICLGARLLKDDEACSIIDTWLTTDFEGGRHERRLSKISDCER